MLSTRTYLLILKILLLGTSRNFEIHWLYFQWNRGRGPAAAQRAAERTGSVSPEGSGPEVGGPKTACAQIEWA